jgi:CRISPR-associated protein Cas1
VGEYGVRFYASGTGITRSANNIMKQARYWTDDRKHLQVVRMMYEMRFPDRLSPELSLQQIRGKEGVRVRDTYARLSTQYGVTMEKRDYDRKAWKNADPINKALSVANSCLYGLCHAAIVAAGYSPALGFVHIGKQLSFVYDIADLYKMETSVPAAFRTVASGVNDLEKRCRMACRDEFHQSNILKSIVADIHKLFDQDLSEFEDSDDYVNDPSAPGDLWNPNGEVSEGGLMYANAQQKEL